MLDKAKKYLLVLFLVCQPLLDALTCIQIKNNWSFISISALVRGLFFLYVLYFVDIQCDMQIFYILSFLGSVEKCAKSLVRQSILHPHLDYLAVSLRLFCIPTLTILHCQTLR